MEKEISLPEAQMEVMEVIWDKEEGPCSAFWGGTGSQGKVLEAQYHSDSFITSG